MRVVTLFPGAEVEARIAALGARLAERYRDQPLTILWIAEGARRFAGALERALGAHGLAPELRCVRARRTSGRQLQEVRLGPLDCEGLAGRHLLVLDDIADRGDTLRAVLARLESASPRSVCVAVLVDKREAGRPPLPVDEALFVVEKGWVVGWGMDLEGEFRELDAIGVVADSA